METGISAQAGTGNRRRGLAGKSIMVLHRVNLLSCTSCHTANPPPQPTSQIYRQLPADPSSTAAQVPQ